MSSNKTFICEVYFTPTKGLLFLFLFLFFLTLIEIFSLYHFIWFYVLSPQHYKTPIANQLQPASIFLEPVHLSQYSFATLIFILIHNINVKDIQVCYCICAEMCWDIDTELYASTLHYLLFLCWRRCPVEFFWL